MYTLLPFTDNTEGETSWASRRLLPSLTAQAVMVRFHLLPPNTMLRVQEHGRSLQDYLAGRDT